MAKAKKIAKKRVSKKPLQPKVVELDLRDKVEIKLMAAKARLNSFWHSLVIAVRGY